MSMLFETRPSYQEMPYSKPVQTIEGVTENWVAFVSRLSAVGCGPVHVPLTLTHPELLTQVAPACVPPTQTFCVQTPLSLTQLVSFKQPAPAFVPPTHDLATTQLPPPVQLLLRLVVHGLPACVPPWQRVSRVSLFPEGSKRAK